MVHQGKTKTRQVICQRDYYLGGRPGKYKETAYRLSGRPPTVSVGDRLLSLAETAYCLGGRRSAISVGDALRSLAATQPEPLAAQQQHDYYAADARISNQHRCGGNRLEPDTNSLSELCELR